MHPYTLSERRAHTCARSRLLMHTYSRKLFLTISWYVFCLCFLSYHPLPSLSLYVVAHLRGVISHGLFASKIARIRSLSLSPACSLVLVLVLCRSLCLCQVKSCIYLDLHTFTLTFTCFFHFHTCTHIAHARTHTIRDICARSFSRLLILAYTLMTRTDIFSCFHCFCHVFHELSFCVSLSHTLARSRAPSLFHSLSILFESSPSLACCSSSPVIKYTLYHT